MCDLTTAVDDIDRKAPTNTPSEAPPPHACKYEGKLQALNCSTHNEDKMTFCSKGKIYEVSNKLTDLGHNIITDFRVQSSILNL